MKITQRIVRNYEAQDYQTQHNPVKYYANCKQNKKVKTRTTKPAVEFKLQNNRNGFARIEVGILRNGEIFWFYLDWFPRDWNDWNQWTEIVVSFNLASLFVYKVNSINLWRHSYNDRRFFTDIPLHFGLLHVIA